MWEGRTVLTDAYQASIELREPTLSMIPSERRSVLFRVCNEGSERWPARLDERPQIRISYRWLNPDESVHTPDGPRSAFPRGVDPGERILTPLHVDAPAVAGDYVLEVDVVHEYVRWFDCACRVPVRVEHPPGLPATGARLRETAPLRFRRWRGYASRARSTACGLARGRCRRSMRSSAERSLSITRIGRCDCGPTRTFRRLASAWQNASDHARTRSFRTSCATSCCIAMGGCMSIPTSSVDGG